MKTILLAIALWPFCLLAQDEPFTPLQSSGVVPSDFLLLSSEKFEADIENIEYDSHSEKNFKKSLLLNVNFQLDRLLTSGRVLYNDPISNYVGEVLDYVLEDDPELRRELRVYTLKSPEVNAMATDQGMVFVSVGLLAQVENEAQLAFILSHELSHYVNQHVMNENLTEFQVDKNRGTHGSSGFNKQMAKARYSRELEGDADQEGLERYLKTNYSLEELNPVFDVLLYSYLPIDEVPYDYSQIFERGEFKLPQEFKRTPEEVNPITAEEDYNDSESTHPNIAKRRDAINRVIEDKSNEGRVEYAVSKDEFHRVRELARRQMLHEYMISGQFGEAIVNAGVILQYDSTDVYAKRVITDAMYAIGRFATSGNLNEAVTNDRKVEGLSNAFFYTMDEISKEAIITHALRINYEYFVETNDTAYYYRCIELASDLTFKFDYDLLNFESIPNDSLSQEEVEQAEEENKAQEEERSKYAKIKVARKTAKKRSKGDEDYFQFALYDIVGDSLLTEIFDEADEFTEFRNEQSNEETSKEDLAQEKSKEKYGRALGMDKILLLTPEYFILDERKKEEVQYLAAEDKYNNWVSSMSDIGKEANLDVEVLDPHFITSDDDQKFNDIVFLNDWIRERYVYDGNTNRLHQSAYVDSLINRYGTRYVGLTGVLNYVDKRDGKALVLLASAISVIYFPYGVYYALTNKKHMNYYMIVFDLKTGRTMMVQNEEMNLMNRTDMLNHMIYDSFYQMSQESNGHD